MGKVCLSSGWSMGFKILEGDEFTSTKLRGVKKQEFNFDFGWLAMQTKLMTIEMALNNAAMINFHDIERWTKSLFNK